MKANELLHYYGTLKETPLFFGISDEDLESMLTCLGANMKNYAKNDIVLLVGSKISSMGIILSGNLILVKEDILGNRMIITELSAGELFAEVYVCAGVTSSPVTVVTVSQAKVLFLGYRKMITTCSTHCGFHNVLIQNMLTILANKNLQLNQKMNLLSKRTTKEKLLDYFQIQMEKQESVNFEIPFSRSELADYLCVDRSALSRELGKLKEEGIITFQRNQFHYLLK